MSEFAGGTKKVRIAYAAIGGGSIPIWTAQEEDIFTENGIDSEVVLVRGSNKVAQGLMAGEIDFANIAAPAAVRLSVKTEGEGLVNLTGGVNFMIQTIVARPELQAAQDLRGRKLGKSGTGDLDEFLYEHLLEPMGIDPEADVSYVTVKNQPDAIEKMRRGSLDAAIFTPPWLYEATKFGLHIVLDAADLAIPYQLGGLIANKRTVEKWPEVTGRVVRSYVEGVHYNKMYPDSVVKSLRKYSSVTDEEVARKCHKRFNEFFQPAPYPTVDGIRTILTQVARQLPEAAEADPWDFVDMRWVEELDKNGFIERLYGEGGEG